MASVDRFLEIVNRNDFCEYNTKAYYRYNDKNEIINNEMIIEFQFKTDRGGPVKYRKAISSNEIEYSLLSEEIIYSKLRETLGFDIIKQWGEGTIICTEKDWTYPLRDRDVILSMPKHWFLSKKYKLETAGYNQYLQEQHKQAVTHGQKLIDEIEGKLNENNQSASQTLSEVKHNG